LTDVKFTVQLSARCNSPNDWETLKTIALQCEELGYDAIWFGDHLATGDSRLECWTILSALATCTKSIRIGSMVLCNNFRNPALLAKMAASLDIISKGRLEFGIGAGGNKDEHESYGYDFPDPRVRIRRLRESLEIIKRMWTQDRPSYHGEYYHIERVLSAPKPLQKPYPPITIGGGGERYTLRVVARYADRWNGFGPLSQYLQKMKMLENYCTQIGRTPSEIEKSYYFMLGIYHNESELGERLKKDYQNLPIGYATSYEKWLEIVRARYILGTPEECLNQIRNVVDSGITHFVIGSERQVTNTRMDELRLFSEEVVRKI
jgi:F420-dependent oxidoreductase-like protein